MPAYDEESERLQRLREEQLRTRDPSAKIDAQQKRLAAHYRKQDKKVTVWRALEYMPTRWWWTLVGGLSGTVLGVLLNIAVQAPWTELVGLALIFVGIVIGRVAGVAAESGHTGWIDKK